MKRQSEVLIKIGKQVEVGYEETSGGIKTIPKKKGG